jgi:DNA ligase-1
MQPQLLTVVEKEDLQTWPTSEWQKWQIEPKRDGFRLLIVDGVPQSRSGKALFNIEHIIEELGRNVKGVVFDGELHGSSWEETSHVARASKSERSTKLTYTVFDVLYQSEWNNKFCERPLVQRQQAMRTAFPETEHVKFVVPIQVARYSEFEIVHKINLAAGCDGTVLKRKDSLYEFKRTKTWLKVKPVLDCDCLVVGMKEGTGKYKGMLGALEVVPEACVKDERTGEHFGPTTFVSGMDDDCRRAWWEQRNMKQLGIINKWIEVSYRKINPSGRLVEPRFVRIREDK